MDYETLKHDGHLLAYQKRQGDGPGIMFLGGYASDMNGTKASYLAERCTEANRNFLRFDYRGHGLSQGEFQAGCIGLWFSDALAVFDRCTEGQQILIGSSMGGWIGLLLALARPERIGGFIGIAAAPDFTEDLLWARLTAKERDRLMQDGFLQEKAAQPGESPLIYTRQLIEEGRNHLLLRSPIALSCPVRLLQGLLDDAVPWSTALKLIEMLQSADTRLTLIKDGDHRLSRAQDCALLWSTIAAISTDSA